MIVGSEVTGSPAFAGDDRRCGATCSLSRRPVTELVFFDGRARRARPLAERHRSVFFRIAINNFRAGQARRAIDLPDFVRIRERTFIRFILHCNNLGEPLRQANAQLHSDRRVEILDAARRCFARMGFHQTSMQQICAEASMSPGNVYRYFPSKEAIIAGITERDRAEVAAQLASTQFSTDFFSTFAALARHHFVERTAEEVGLCAEIMSESRRNPTISKIMKEFDADVKDRLVTMLQGAQARGDIARDADIGTAVEMLMIIADGVWWRRAVDPNFDAEAVLPMFFDVTKYMLLDRGNGRKANPEWMAAGRAGEKK